MEKQREKCSKEKMNMPDVIQRWIVCTAGRVAALIKATQ